MSTKHELCDSPYGCNECDSTLAGYEYCDHDPMLEEALEAHENTLRTQSAIAALKAVQKKIREVQYQHMVHGNATSGLSAALYWISQALKRVEEEGIIEFELTPEVGGNFPDGYFDESLGNVKGGAA